MRLAKSEQFKLLNIPNFYSSQLERLSKSLSSLSEVLPNFETSKSNRMNKKVIIEKKGRVLDDFFKVEEVQLKHEKFDGSMSKSMRRLNFERGDSVAIVLWNTDKEAVLLTNQFRYPTYAKGEDGWILELIAGSVKPDEDLTLAMQREIEEEVGYDCQELEHIQTFFVSPGGTSERIHLFYGEVRNSQKNSEGGGLAQENEDIQLVEWNKTQITDSVKHGEVKDAKTLIGFMWFLQNK
ncbi:MAG: ADP-ribose pyrophosphatase [Flammeovirgaceae bacterium]